MSQATTQDQPLDVTFKRKPGTKPKKIVIRRRIEPVNIKRKYKFTKKAKKYVAEINYKRQINKRRIAIFGLITIVLLGLLVAAGVYIVQENNRKINNANTPPDEVSAAQSSSTATIIAMVVVSVSLLAIGTYSFYRYARSARIYKDQIKAAILQGGPPPDSDENEAQLENDNAESNRKLSRKTSRRESLRIKNKKKTKTPFEILMRKVKEGTLGSTRVNPETPLGQAYAANIQKFVTDGVPMAEAVQKATISVLKEHGIDPKKTGGLSTKDLDKIYESVGAEKQTNRNGDKIWNPSTEQLEQVNNLLAFRTQLETYEFYKKRINNTGTWLDFLEFEQTKVQSPWKNGKKISGAVLMYLAKNNIEKQSLTKEQVRDINGFVKKQTEGDDAESLSGMKETIKEQDTSFTRAGKDKQLNKLESEFTKLAKKAEAIDKKIESGNQTEVNEATQNKTKLEQSVTDLKDQVNNYLFSIASNKGSEDDKRALATRTTLLLELIKNLESYNEGGNARDKVYGNDGMAKRNQKVYKNVTIDPKVFGVDVGEWIQNKKEELEKERFKNETPAQRVERMFKAVASKVDKNLHSRWKSLYERKEKVNEQLEKATHKFKKKAANETAKALNNDIENLNKEIENQDAHIDKVALAPV